KPESLAKKRISRDVLRTIIRRLSRDEVVSAKTDSILAKPDQARLDGPSAQLRATSAPAQLPRHSWSSLLRKGLRLGSRSLPEGTDWDCQHTLVNLILSAQAIGGEPSPSTMAIVPKPSRIDLYRDHLGSVSAENDLAIAEESQYSTPQILQPGQLENTDRTLKELATLDVVYQPWCIQYPQLEPAQTYELKSGLIHLLPKFHGLAGEDPHKHLKEFHVVCSTMRSQGISEDYIKMKVFPFSLDGAAKDWLYLQLVLFNTWGEMKRTFLEKFFPASRTASIRKEICGIRQHTGETLHEYWERFNKLCATCPHHQISEQLLIQYFYEGLSMMDKSMIDAASGGALMDKTPAAARHLISNMASNIQ
ncbi:hypothetical protein CR513_31531, partial [Mucuna pruriens]